MIHHLESVLHRLCNLELLSFLMSPLSLSLEVYEAPTTSRDIVVSTSLRELSVHFNPLEPFGFFTSCARSSTEIIGLLGTETFV